jgi:mannose-6-phosphate isomerase-like protein (cupin superfamily)
MPANPDAAGAGARAYPYTIDNGAGERLTFLRRVPGPSGDRLEVENVVKPGSGPVMHVHHHQEEALTVERGRIGYRRPGEAARFAGPGETVVFRAGEPHKFWNAGEEDLRCAGYIEPADNIEYFLAAIFGSQRRGGGTRPNPLDAAFLARRYRSEFGMPGIPAPVRRLVFPVLVALGRALGRYERYADAPEPVRR